MVIKQFRLPGKCQLPPYLSGISYCYCDEFRGWEAGGQGDPGSNPLLLPHSGQFRIGPSPLSAIRQGAVQTMYDTTFVFTEVNGDKYIWLVKQNQEREKNVLIAVETASIGKNISTKMVGENRRQDITLHYKFPEGSCVITGQFQDQDSPWWMADLRPKRS